MRKAAANDNWIFAGLGTHYAHYQTTGNLALKSALEEAANDCPIRFQGQWQDEETGITITSIGTMILWLGSMEARTPAD